MVRTPQAPDAQTVLPVAPPLPGWARNEPPVVDTEADTGAAFQAGAALAALDARVRADAPAPSSKSAAVSNQEFLQLRNSVTDDSRGFQKDSIGLVLAASAARSWKP